ncbi:hypothetical protein GCM10027299_43270 [Larkinella ripae]
MNTPSYIIERNNQVMVSLRPLYEQAGFAPKHFPEWISTRLGRTKLSPGKDFETFKQGHHIQYLMPVPVALSILDTLPNERTQSAKRLITDSIKGLTGNEPENSPAQPLTESEQAITPTHTENTPKAANLAANLPIPLYQIEGRAAVSGLDLFKQWNDAEDRRLGAWMSYRIDKMGLILGKDYVEFVLPPSPAHRRGFTGYLLSLNAAISIADAEKKGQGKVLAALLIDYRKELSKLRLSTKGLLSDFIGAEPINKPVSDLQGIEPANDAAEEQKVAQASLFDQNTQAGGSETTQEVTDKIVPDPEEPESAEQNGDSRFGGDNSPNSQSEQERPSERVAEDALEDYGQKLFDLMVSFAQSLLQQAQALSDQYKTQQETKNTVSALVGIEQEAGRRKMGLHRGSAEIPVLTLRDKIRHAVSKRASVTKEDHDKIYKHIYKRLQYDYGISVGDFPRQKDETHLGACERWGLLDTVWQIVDSREFNAYDTHRQAA